jgi:uncharacterized protein (TIGR02145 family)
MKTILKFLKKTKLASLLLLLLFLFFPAANAQISNIQANFSCPGEITVTYDLQGSKPKYVTLYYSSDKCTWLEAITVEGDTGLVSPGTDKAIIWNNYADYVRFGKFYFKIEFPPPPSCADLGGILFGGVCWATQNLNVDGTFAVNPEDNGALYQWGRLADGHEDRNSLCFNNGVSGVPCSSIGNFQISNLDANGQPSVASGAIGLFIRQNTGNYDWRTPGDPNLWNSGTPTTPEKGIGDPCPEGWRVPTKDEYDILITYVKPLDETSPPYVLDNLNGVFGRFFDSGDPSQPPLFLPAAGYRTNQIGSIIQQGSRGYYWSSSPTGPTNAQAFQLSFYCSGTSVILQMGQDYRACAKSIRCVAE